MKRPLALTTAALLLAGCGQGDISDLRGYVEQVRQETEPLGVDPLPKMQPYRPFAYTAYGLRDPFEPAAFLQEIPPVTDSGIQPNLNRPRELLEQYSLESLQMVGTMDKDTLWALVRAPDGVVHRVTAGNYMGTNHGRITDVSPDRVELVEIVPDGLGGWEQRDSYLSLAD